MFSTENMLKNEIIDTPSPLPPRYTELFTFLNSRRVSIEPAVTGTTTTPAPLAYAEPQNEKQKSNPEFRDTPAACGWAAGWMIPLTQSILFYFPPLFFS